MDISIIITTCQRTSLLERLLRSIANAPYSFGQTEILIVDDDPSATAHQIINSMSDTLQLTLKYLNSKGRGPSVARNLGIAHAKNDVVILLDDDVEVTTTYFDQCYTTLSANPNAVIIGGKNLSRSVAADISIEAWLHKLPHDWWLFAQTSHPSASLTPLKLYEIVYSANMCIRKHILPDQTMVFDALHLGRKYGSKLLFGEDYELCMRMILLHKLVLYEPLMVCYHNLEEKRFFWKYINQRYYYAGIERRKIDNQLSKYPLYSRYKFEFWELLHLVSQLRLNSDLDSIQHQLWGKILFTWGYYIVEPWIR